MVTSLYKKGNSLQLCIAGKMATTNIDVLWEDMIESNRDFLCDSIEITEKFKNFIPNEILARHHWEEIEHSPQMKKKVGKLLDFLSKREKEEAFTVLARSLWKSEQSKPAKGIDPHELYRSKVIAWFCANEYQANAAMSVLSKFVGENAAVGTRVPRAISTGQNVTYCKVEALLDDWNSRYVRHRIILSYPESEEKAVIGSYVRDVERRYKPNYVVHIGTAVSQGNQDVCISLFVRQPPLVLQDITNLFIVASSLQHHIRCLSDVHQPSLNLTNSISPTPHTFTQSHQLHTPSLHLTNTTFSLHLTNTTPLFHLIPHLT